MVTFSPVAKGIHTRVHTNLRVPPWISTSDWLILFGWTQTGILKSDFFDRVPSTRFGTVEVFVRAILKFKSFAFLVQLFGYETAQNEKKYLIKIFGLFTTRILATVHLNYYDWTITVAEIFLFVYDFSNN